MGRPCSACQHDDREAIDAALVAGEPLRAVARRWCGLSKDGLRRHRDHVSEALIALKADEDQAQARSLRDRVEALISRIERLADAAEEDGKAGLMLQASRELRETYRLHGHLTGELRDQPQVAVLNLTASTEWIELRTRLMNALERHPAALSDGQRALEASNA